MSIKVLKIPVPNEQAFAVRFKGRVLEILDLAIEVFREKIAVDASGQGRAKAAVMLYVLIDEGEEFEDHHFVLIQTGQQMPPIDFEIRYISSAMLDMRHTTIELHLFHGGVTIEYAAIDLPVAGHA